MPATLYVRTHGLLRFLEELVPVRAVETIKSWDIDELHVPGFVAYGNEFGLTSLLS